MPAHDARAFLGSMDPIGGEHTSKAPSVKPSTIAGLGGGDVGAGRAARQGKQCDPNTAQSRRHVTKPIITPAAYVSDSSLSVR